MQNAYKIANIKTQAESAISLNVITFDIIADVIGNKKRTPIVTELFIKQRKLNISTVFIT